MADKTIRLTHGRVEISEYEDFFYFKHHGDYTDDDVIKVARYTEQLYCQGGQVPAIRIYDGTLIDNFMLTTQGINRFTQWADRAKQMWPKSTVYLITNNQLSFGMSRMFEIKASDNKMPIHVLHSLDELPGDILRHLKGRSE